MTHVTKGSKITGGGIVSTLMVSKFFHLCWLDIPVLNSGFLVFIFWHKWTNPLQRRKPKHIKAGRLWTQVLISRSCGSFKLYIGTEDSCLFYEVIILQNCTQKRCVWSSLNKHYCRPLTPEIDAHFENPFDLKVALMQRNEH